MEKIINFKAKKKKLIYKTEILDNICIYDEVQIRINNLANDFFFYSYDDNHYIYDNNFTNVSTFGIADIFQLDEYTFFAWRKKIIRFNKQYNNYSILYNINENLQFIFKLDSNIYIFKRNEDLVILEEGERNIFCKYELSNVFEEKKNFLFYDSENINYFAFSKTKFGLCISDTFIIFEFKDKCINILNKKSIKLKIEILKVIMAKENIIVFLCEKYYEYFLYTFNIEAMEIISIFNISDNTNNKIYFSLDDINAFKFMRIIDEDLYNKYHKYIKNKKKVLKIIIKETDINKLDDDVVTNYQIYFIMSNYLIIKGPVIDIGSFCSLYYDNGFDTKKFIFRVKPFMEDMEFPEKNADDDDYGYSYIQYRNFLSKNKEYNDDIVFLFNKKAIIFNAEGDINDQHNCVYALSYIKFKKIKIFKKITAPKK